MNRVVRIVLLAFISITTLSSCLVEKKDLVQITSKTGNVHVYQPGEYIDYFVTATTSGIGGTTVQTGTLHIKWVSHGGLVRPGADTTLIPVVKEVATLTYDGASSNPKGAVRYISQTDIANPGQITLHAINDVAGFTSWLSTIDLSGSNIPTESFTIFESPLSVGLDQLPIGFYIMEGCDQASGTCVQPLGQYSDNMNTVGNTASITTNLGIVTNPFQISFNGTTIPGSGFPILDVRNICGAATTTHAGTMFVIPEVGMIQMTNTCNDPTSPGGSVIYNISIRSTNIPLP